MSKPKIIAVFTLGGVFKGYTDGSRLLKLYPTIDKEGEYKSWSEATPSGSLELTIKNNSEVAESLFKENIYGKKYRVTIEEEPE